MAHPTETYKEFDDESGGVSRHEKRSNRLRVAREKAGYDSAAAAAIALGKKVSTYTSHENGTRGFKETTGRVYADAFGVSVSWLMLGASDVPSVSDVLSFVDGGEEATTPVERAFREAYKESRECEKELLGGPGPRLAFAKMLKIILEEKLADLAKAENTSLDEST